MRVKNMLGCLLGVLAMLAGCGVNDLDEGHDDNLSEYVRLHFYGGDITDTLSTRAVWSDLYGEGSLKFRWEKTSEGSQNQDWLSLILSDGGNPIATSAGEDSCHTALLVTPHEKNPNLASFETAGYYLQEDLDRAAYCFSAAGSSEIIADLQGRRHLCTFEMPSLFNQSKSQDPSFLREYMHMYATAEYVKDDLLLLFNHIPATLRFIITNHSTIPCSVESVSISLTDTSGSAAGHVASGSSALVFDWTSGDAVISYGDDGSASVTTAFSGDDTLLKYGGKYIAYSMAVPLPDDNAFKDKVLNFIVKCDGGKETCVQISCEDFAAKNGGVYNWIGGKSYTLKLDIGGNPAVSGEILDSNVIEISAAEGGEYTLMYEGADGTPLADYDEICTLTVQEMAYYEEFIDVNVAPREAGSIGIYDSQMNRLWCIFINDFKPVYTEPIYSFGLLSDVHVTPVNKHDCIGNFQNALTFLNCKGVEFTTICGDISEEGTDEEYAVYKEVVDTYSPNVPVYTTSGNHDAQSALNEVSWKAYTGQDMVFEISRTLPDGSADHFLFLGMKYGRGSSAYRSEHVAWLESKLQSYKGERCFVITHLFFPDRAGNMNEVYPPSNWLSGKYLDMLSNLCDSNLNSLWFSGHSHWKWSLQKYDKKANIYRVMNEGQPASGWCVHVPSCVKPQDSNGLPRGESGSRVEKSKESEGAIVHVYEDYIDIIGIDFKTSKYLPIATYRLTTN